MCTIQMFLLDFRPCRQGRVLIQRRCDVATGSSTTNFSARVVSKDDRFWVSRENTCMHIDIYSNIISSKVQKLGGRTAEPQRVFTYNAQAAYLRYEGATADQIRIHMHVLLASASSGLPPSESILYLNFWNKKKKMNLFVARQSLGREYK